MQEFVQAQGGTCGSMIVDLSHLRGFFIRNGIDIPLALNRTPEPTREPVEGSLIGGSLVFFLYASIDSMHVIVI